MSTGPRDFLHTKNTYYSGIAGALGGLIGGKPWHSALISSTIATVDVACFPQERPRHIGPGKWFAGNLLSSTAAGLVAYGIGHGVRSLVAQDQESHEPKTFAENELEKRQIVSLHSIHYL